MRLRPGVRRLSRELEAQRLGLRPRQRGEPRRALPGAEGVRPAPAGDPRVHLPRLRHPARGRGGAAGISGDLRLPPRPRGLLREGARNPASDRLRPQVAEEALVWEPGEEAVERARLAAFRRWLEAERGLSFVSYAELQRWSVADLDGF